MFHDWCEINVATKEAFLSGIFFSMIRIYCVKIVLNKVLSIPNEHINNEQCKEFAHI